MKTFPCRPIVVTSLACLLACPAILLQAQEQPSAGVMPHSLAVISGKPRQRGVDYGSKFKKPIQAFLQKEIYGRYTPKPQYPKEKILDYARQCSHAIKDFSPLIHEEMEGMADGAGMKLEELVLISLHEELWLGGVLPKVEHCTPYAAGPPDTRDGKTYVGQTWDWMTSVHGQSSALLWKRQEGPSVLSYAYPGLWVSAGMNSEGLALCWVTGPGYGKGPRVGVPAYVMVAHLLYQESLEKALAEVRKDKHAGTFRFVLADAKGQQAIVGCSPAKIDIVEKKGQADPTGRMTKHLTGVKDKLDLSTLQGAMQRVSYPGKQVMTVDGMVFNTTDRVAYFTRGPTLGPWQRFTFDER